MPQKSHLPGHLDSIRTKLRPKHQLLVLKCYPRLPKNSAADVKPNGSELSYLLYYASTRKSKLQKVGTFLEKKTASDVYKWQSARVAVTLQILTALLENKSIGSSAAFPLFAPYVLRILREILQNTNDVNLVEASLDTWDVFCKHQDQATLAADHDYRSLYQDVVGKYAGYARKEGSKKLGKNAVAVQDAIRLRKAGLGALKSVLMSDALASEAGRQLDIVVPAILGNLRGEDEIYLEHLVRLQKRSERDEKQKAIDRRQSMATVRASTGLTFEDEADPRQAEGTAQDADELADEEVAVLALECLRTTFATDNRPQIRTAASAILKYLAALHAGPSTAVAEKGGVDDSLTKDTWATKLFEICTTWTAVQDRFILLVTAVETLVRLPLKESDLREHLLYTALVDHIFRSDLNLIGLSVMDILLSLIQQILRVLQLSGPRVPGRSSATQLFPSDEEKEHPQPAEASEKPTLDMPSEARLRLMARLKNCIADLGTHVYYTDQITDMLAAILMRLKPNPTSTTGQQNPLATAAAIEEPQSAVLETASNVSLSARQRSSSAGGSGFFSFDTARQIALEAVRDVLIVANHGGTRRSLPTIQTSSSDGVADSRHKVPLAIWEGTQWLLRDPSPDVRRAYVDALTTWIRLETTKRDSRIKEPKQKTPKKDRVVARRAVSNASRKARDGVIGGQGKKVTHTFLSLLHLAVYENALQFASVGSPEAEKEIALLHLLLTTLTQKLGVNAVQTGLPMMFALQDEAGRAERVDQKTRLGSLVLGYFWGIDDTFDLDVTAAGRELFTEITKRRREGVWMKEISVPAADLKRIAEFESFTPTTADDSVVCQPFTSRQTLVDLIADAYASGPVTSPPASTPGSPGRSFTSPALERSGTSSYLTAKQPPNASTAGTVSLPDKVKTAMLEPWTKESCLATIAANAPKSVSLSASRSSPNQAAQQLAVGAAAGNHRQLLAAVTTPGASSRNPSAQRQQGQGLQSGVGGGRYRSPDRRRQTSASTPSGRARTSSSARKGTVKVEDLKRILNGEGPTVPISFGTHNVVDDTASESLVDDEGYEEGKSEEGGFVTPPQGPPQGQGVTDGVEGEGEKGAGPPVLNLPSDAVTDGQMRPPPSSSSAANNTGHVSVINGGIDQRPPPSRGGASMRSARSTKTRAERKKDVLALLDEIKIDEKPLPAERKDALAAVKAPPY